MKDTIVITPTTNALRSLNIASAFVMMITLFVRYRISYLERYIQLDLNSEGTYLDPSDYVSYFFEITVNCFFLPPVVKAFYPMDLLGGKYNFKVDSLAVIFSLLRVYHFARLYVHFSVWFTGETQLICKKFGFIPDLYFVIKTELK